MKAGFDVQRISRSIHGAGLDIADRFAAGYYSRMEGVRS
jgi:hypothetical protein